MKNLITLISGLTVTEYKTYKSYLPIAVLPGSCVLAINNYSINIFTINSFRKYIINSEKFIKGNRATRAADRTQRPWGKRERWGLLWMKRAENLHGLEISYGKLLLVYFMRPPSLEALGNMRPLGPWGPGAISPRRLLCGPESYYNHFDQTNVFHFSFSFLGGRPFSKCCFPPGPS